ncbi:MAG: methyl-accepting chemotaxis protein [Treponema sp.]|jgi:methyl-accepting chemotaxis protein|nr:methyl-accepting chemotaxis protein [Treponema sp.]
MINKKYVFLSFVLTTGAVMLLADFLLLIFFGNTHTDLFSNFAVPALVFLAIYCVVLGLSARFFDKKFFKDADKNALLDKLKKIGSVPIRMIVINVVLHAAFLAVIFAHGSLALDPAIKSPLFLTTLSFGMFIGTFLYVACDGLVFKTLLSHNLTKYPRGLRERRQELKAMIIPTAAVLMALLFSCSVTILGIRMAGDSVDHLPAVAWLTFFIPITILFICIAFLAFNLKKNTFLQYNSIIEQIENISSGNKDLRRRINVCSVDELGTIAGMVNSFCEDLGTGLRDIKGEQKELSGVGSQLEEHASNMAASISQMTNTAESVLAKTNGQIKTIKESSKVIYRISDHIKTLDESIGLQTSSMSQASSAVEEMVGNISSIGSVAEKMAVQFETVSDAAKKGIRIQGESKERINNIVTQSESLQKANKIISTIAAQTNLLAMNAAIEAAHAGEAGRGFSVVADEVRKLAISSSEESQGIRNQLREIVRAIALVVKDSEASGHAFYEVSRRIDETGKLISEVTNAVREQKTGATQVIDSLHEMNNITVKVRDGSQKMNAGSVEMLNEINALKNSAGEIKTSMEEISSGIKVINSGAQEVSSLADTTYSSIDKISSIANGFEV